MKRTFEVTVKLSGNFNNFDEQHNDGIYTFKFAGNKRSTEKSIISQLKRDCGFYNCKIEQIIEFKEL